MPRAACRAAAHPLAWSTPDVAYAPFDPREYPRPPDSVAARPASDRPPLALVDLLNTFDQLASLLRAALRNDDALNAYLLAVGLNQIAEDHLHADPWSLGRAATHLTAIPGRAGRLTAKLAQASAIGASHLLLRAPRAQRLSAWQAELAELVHALAPEVVSSYPAQVFERRKESLEVLLSRVRTLPPALRSAVVRLPSCFRSFDQRPEDLLALVRRLSQVHVDRHRPMVVIGVRTSGSYLAPLCGAALELEGYSDVSVLTARPGHPFLAAELARLRALAGRGALFLIVDDPPATGDAIDRAAKQVQQAGVRSDQLLLLLALAGPASALPPKLAPYEGVYLPLSEWAVHQRLNPAAIARELALLLAPAAVVGINRLLDPEPPPGRGHVRALYRVGLEEPGTGRRRDEDLLVRGVGFGYLGDHTLAVTSALQRFLPRLHGVRDGLAYEEWLPPTDRLRVTDGDLDDVARRMADYVLARHRALPVRADTSMSVVGRGAAWEVAANLFSQVFGQLWFIARIPLVDPVVRRILEVSNPSVVDGSTRSSRWFVDPTGTGNVRKVEADERAFSHLDLSCYDPVFDLAGMLADGDGPCVAELARRAYEQASGERVTDERWMIHQLVHLWDRERSDTTRPTVSGRAKAQAMQRYLAGLYLSDVDVPDEGPLCAIDIDGVLESDALGFPAGSPLGTCSLRALTRHGFRPVLVTGRSLADVKDRCSAYRLAGGVAEYGSVTYVHGHGTSRALVSDEMRARLDEMRKDLTARPGIVVDNDYQASVRASRVGHDGRPRPLDDELVEQVLEGLRLGSRVRVIRGDAQTDLVAADVDKGTGLAALAEDLGIYPSVTAPAVAAMAIGDTGSDLPMLARATMALAPGNADEEVRTSGIKVLRRQYQAGLAEAVRRLVGHRPGTCPECRPAEFAGDTRLLLALLSAREDGLRGLAGRTAQLALRIVGFDSW